MVKYSKCPGCDEELKEVGFQHYRTEYYTTYQESTYIWRTKKQDAELNIYFCKNCGHTIHKAIG